MTDETVNSGRVLIMDDVKDDVFLIIRHLRDEGFKVDFVDTTDAALKAFVTNRYDVAILDPLMMPKIQLALLRIFKDLVVTKKSEVADEYQGFGVANWLRENQPEVGVIMLTGNVVGNEATILAFELGADDYIKKKQNSKIELDIFCARVRSLVRRCRPFDGEKFSFSSFDVLVKPQKITSESGGFEHLTDAEFMALKLLFTHRNDVVSRDQILEYARPSSLQKDSSRTVDNLISKIREKLARLGEKEPPIQTIRGKGYLLEDLPNTDPQKKSVA